MERGMTIGEGDAEELELSSPLPNQVEEPAALDSGGGGSAQDDDGNPNGDRFPQAPVAASFGRGCRCRRRGLRAGAQQEVDVFDLAAHHAPMDLPGEHPQREERVFGSSGRRGIAIL